jgi:ATP-dependent Clp protease ATP-binding subunit ClpX
VCGGTFNGLDKIIRNRIENRAMGFEATIQSKESDDMNKIMPFVQPEDLIRYGMIPEFIGRLPILATLDDLSLDALARILTEPRNALVKQYKKLFEMEGVSLKFTEESLQAIAKDALKRKSGARGLRAILESVMLDIMYDIPSMHGVRECVINEEVIHRKGAALYLYENQVGYA